MPLKYDRFINRINSLKLARFDGIDIGSALYFNCFDYTGPVPASYSVKRILGSLILRDVAAERGPGCGIGFLFSNSYKSRKDHMVTMKKVEDLFPDACRFHPGSKRICLSNLRYLPSVFQWLLQLRRVFPFQEAVCYTHLLLHCLGNADYIVQYALQNQLKKMIVFSDMNAIDSLVVQKCNQKGIITATLQHGNFEIDDPFLLSKSKYFLCYGERARRRGISCGLDGDRMIRVGILKYIGVKTENKIRFREPRVRSIGIILSSNAGRDADIEMIRMFKAYSAEQGIKLKVKCHPAYGKEKYPEVNWDDIEAYVKEITSEEFVRDVDLVIAYNSTVFLECMMQMIPAFLYQDENGSFYEGFEWCRFHSIREFSELQRKLEEDREAVEERMLTSRAYYTETGDLGRRYREAIEALN